MSIHRFQFCVVLTLTLFVLLRFIVIQFSGENDEPFDVIRWLNSTRRFVIAEVVPNN